MVEILIPGAPSSALLKRIKAALKSRLAATDTSAFPKFAEPSAPYDEQCLAAVRTVQSRNGLIEDGVIGPLTLSVLGLDGTWPTLPPGIDVALVQAMFPHTRRSNIERQLPYVLAALRAVGPGASEGQLPLEIVLSALATIRAETEGFLPISEGRSKYNTDPGQPDFNRYLAIRGLGNTTLQDAQNFRGRGFVQLTGRANFERFGACLGLDLAQHYELANHPEIAGCLLAEFIRSKADKLLGYLRLSPPNFAQARKLVNGGTHGLDRYQQAYEIGLRAPRPTSAVAGRALRAKGAKSAATRKARLIGKASAPRRNAKRDPLDLRDRLYSPRVSPLPAAYPPPEVLARSLSLYANPRAGLILDQGREGSCTGFGLACVVNFQRWILAGRPTRGFESVSPRMLYEMARRYDEYEGEDYDGSSCRGAIRGFHQNGVCRVSRWPYHPERELEPLPDWLQDARENTLGVYYRVDTKIIADLQAAIVEAHAVFVSVATHDGWGQVPTRTLTARSTMKQVPDIAWPSATDGGAHAFALVGFDREGFILQNSWGRDWGAGGFARISYGDWLANAMDAWVLSLGVPGVLPRTVSLKVPPQALYEDKAGAGALDARRYTVEMGNDGRIDAFYGEDERRRRLDYQAATLPAQWMRERTPAGQPWRLALYAHGGLTSLNDALKKTATMAPYYLANGIYPLFLGWKTGGLETPAHILEDGWNDLVRREGPKAGAGAGDWLRKKRDEAVEGIARGPVRSLWSEMKENARRAARDGHGLDLLALALDELVRLSPWGLEIHLVGHSAGSILLGHFLRRIGGSKALAPRSIHLFAPACTVDCANNYYDAWFDRTYLHLLSDRAELADCVTSAYGKSLLYLVANALEDDKRTPLLGMERSFLSNSNGKWNGLAATLANLNRLQAEYAERDTQGRLTMPRLQLYDTPITTSCDLQGKPLSTESPTHGGFDNDVNVLTRVLTQMLGKAPTVRVTDLRNS